MEDEERESRWRSFGANVCRAVEFPPSACSVGGNPGLDGFELVPIGEPGVSIIPAIASAIGVGGPRVSDGEWDLYGDGFELADLALFEKH